MKKILFWVVIAIIAVGVVVGAVFGIRALVNNNKNNKTDEDVSIEYVYEIRDKYKVGDNIIYNMTMQDDTTITALKYTIDHGEEIVVDGVAGEVKDNEDYSASDGAYYYETGDQLISLEGLSEGTHVLTFYMYQDTVRTEISVHTFKLIAK